MRRQTRKLKFQQLEARNLLAGDVAVSFDSTTGLLDIEGDHRGNEIEVVRMGDDILINGIDTNILGPTSVPAADLVDIAIRTYQGQDREPARRCG